MSSFVLGDGEDTTIVLWSRGCRQVLGTFPAQVEGTSWNRKLNGTSTAGFTFQLGGEDESPCCDDLADIWPWAVEAGICWGGEIIWQGPVTEVEYQYDRVVINASDYSGIFNRRVLSRNHIHTGTDITDVWAEYWEDGIEKENGMGLVLETESCDVSVTRAVYAEDKPVLADCLQELTRGGFDWTMLGRLMVVTCPTNDILRQVICLNDSDFITPPVVRIRGNSQATCVWVKGGDEPVETIDPATGDSSESGTGVTITPVETNSETFTTPVVSGEDADPESPDVAPVGGSQQSSSQETITVSNDEDFPEEGPVCGKCEDEDWEEAVGLLERVFDETQTVFNQSDAEDLACQYLDEFKRPVYLEVGGQLRPCAPVCWQELVPGNIVKISSSATCFDSSGYYRLSEVSGDGNGNVSIVLSPLGASSLDSSSCKSPTVIDTSATAPTP